MKIKVEDITEAGLDFELSTDGKEIKQVGNFDFDFSGTVNSKLRIFRSGKYVTLQGAVEAVLNPVCSRCLNDFELPLNADFVSTVVIDESLLNAADKGRTKRKKKKKEEKATKKDEKKSSKKELEELELEKEDLDLIHIEGDELDLTLAVTEQIALEAPIKPLCLANCKGLCSYCGADLNDSKYPDGQCDCAPSKKASLSEEKAKEDKIDPRFSVLKDFKTKS